MQVSVGIPAFNYFGYLHKSGSSGLYNNSMFNFLRDSQTIFHILNSCQQYMKLPNFCTSSPTPLSSPLLPPFLPPYLPPSLLSFPSFLPSLPPSLSFSLFFLFSHLNRCELVSHCGFGLHFLNDTECLSMFLLAICIY